MPLPLPKLDNRTFDQLVAEGQLQIPRLAPGWTDHNASDPGITLLELLAWLVEIDIYRLDRTSLAMLKTFLRRLGVEPRPAAAAEAVLVWQTSDIGPHELPPGIQVGEQGGRVFETSDSLVISPASLVALLAQEADRSPALAGSPVIPFGPNPLSGAALYLGFDRQLANAGQEISLYFWTQDPAGDRQTRERLAAEWQAQLEDAARDCQNAAKPVHWRAHYRARTAWEYYSTALSAWTALPAVIDDTRALTLSGGVRFAVPADMGADQPQAGAWFIRCRLAEGGYECPPRLAQVALNACLARHAAQRPGEELLGVSSGAAGQSFPFAKSPVVPGSLVLRVAHGGGSQLWREAASLDQLGPHAAAMALNDARGALLAGNGRNGRIPPAGAQVFARYAVGGGEDGMLPAGSLDRPLPGAPNEDLLPGWAALLPRLSVRQPQPALGGSDAENLAGAQGRALELLAQSQRAVTLDDLAQLALAAPGLPVDRARALPNYYPPLPCAPAPGCVTLVVVASCPEERPEPSPELLQAVRRYVERRLPLTTELHLIAPSFTAVRVTATLHLHPGANGEQVRIQALQRLDSFLHPLRGGPEYTGWPVGRDVYRSEVMALLHEVRGVAFVTGLGLQGLGDEQPRCGNLPICPDGLVTPGAHDITIVADNPARGNVRALKGVCDDE